MVNEIINDAKRKFDSTIEHLQGELAIIRSSQASPSLVEDIEVNAYEGTYPLKEVAAISSPEANIILIQPWDQTIIEAIESAITKSNLGVSPAVDGTNIRITMPALSEERRAQYAKTVGQLAEDARVAVRNIRQDKMKAIDGLEEDGKISEDERDAARQEVQDLVDEYNKKINEIKEKKIAAIMSV